MWLRRAKTVVSWDDACALGVRLWAVFSISIKIKWFSNWLCCVLDCLWVTSSEVYLIRHHGQITIVTCLYLQLLVQTLSVWRGLDISLSWPSSRCPHISLLTIGTLIIHWTANHLRWHSISPLTTVIFGTISWWSRLKEEVVLHFLLILMKSIWFFRAIYYHSISALEVHVARRSAVESYVVIVVDSLYFVLIISTHTGSGTTTCLVAYELLDPII